MNVVRSYDIAGVFGDNLQVLTARCREETSKHGHRGRSTCNTDVWAVVVVEPQSTPTLTPMRGVQSLQLGDAS